MESLFLPVPSTSCLLTSLRTLHAVDCSGSTAGDRLKHELLSVSMISSFLSNELLLAWSGDANFHHDFKTIGSSGGTIPSCIVPFLVKYNALVLYTDGEIDNYQMTNFENKLASLNKTIPIIIIFTMDSKYNLSNTIVQLENQVNMSIPQACLKCSSDVLLAVNLSGTHKILMSKGIFNIYGPDFGIEPTTKLSSLPDFDMTLLQSLSFRILPENTIWINNAPLSLPELYKTQYFDGIDDILTKINNRVFFPNMDLDKLRTMLNRLLREMIDNPILNELRERLATLSVNISKHKSDEHMRLLEEINTIRKTSKNNTFTKTRHIIQTLLENIAEYESNKMTIALGSNRANRAKTISVDILNPDKTKCILFECPIYLEEDIACILITKPKIDHDLISFCTNDNAMEAPFYFGKVLYNNLSLTTGLFGLEFASHATFNPITRETVIGFIPLSKDPIIIMASMSKIFGASKVLWHFVRAYISLMIHHITFDEWAEKTIIMEQLNGLIDNYDCTFNLKGDRVIDGTTEGTIRAPLRQCLKNVVTNYASCLRERYGEDVRCITKIVDVMMPEFVYPKNKIMGMINIIEIFANLLNRYKAHENMLPLILNLDDYEHCCGEKIDAESIIARLFWYDSKSKRPVYTGFRLQAAIDHALHDPIMGQYITCLFTCEIFPTRLPPIAYDEPFGDHFDRTLQSPSWTEHSTFPTDRCIYCGMQFADNVVKNLHLTKAMGKWFFNGQQAVLEAIQIKGSYANEKELFIEAKKILYHKYGDDDGALHTQRCKKVLLAFIHKLT
jgi:hypothetical protein